MNKEEKNRRRALRQNLKNEERSAFEKSLPSSRSDLEALFDHLDEHLDDCDYSLRLTCDFIRNKKLNEETMVTWLNDNGGYCDCEVLANVEDKWMQIFGEQ